MNFPDHICHFFLSPLKGIILMIFSSVLLTCLGDGLFFLGGIFWSILEGSVNLYSDKYIYAMVLLLKFLGLWLVWLASKIHLRFASLSRQFRIFLFGIIFPSFLEFFSLTFYFFSLMIHYHILFSTLSNASASLFTPTPQISISYTLTQ